MKLPGRYVVSVSALLLAFGGAAAADVTQNLSLPLNGVFVDSCLGEPVALTGELHALVIQQQTGNGLMQTTHFQPQGVSGTGLVTGAKYRGTGVTKTTMFTDAAPPFDFTYINNFRIIGAGEANNSMVHVTIHMTVNAKGEVTADVGKTDISCRP